MRKSQYDRELERTRDRRMAWWRQARYGMFVHWGLYAQLGRHEWVMGTECIPAEEYEKLADRWKPRPRPMRQWARLAVRAGMKYMVMTTKHLEGFCLWDTKQTDFNAVRRGPGRDLVAEFVEACREFGLGVGFYYCLADWHQESVRKARKDATARRALLDFTQGCIRELMSNYGRVDVLWYDAPWPLGYPHEWESNKMNRMVRRLQPDILINDRTLTPEDFTCPEGVVRPAEAGRDWEACMTFNDWSWGYMPAAAVDAHGPRRILQMLNVAAGGAGNLLLNIGPAPDGSVPPESVGPLKTVGKWLAANGEAVYGRVDRTAAGGTHTGAFSQKGKTLYLWCRYWQGGQLSLGGYKTKLRSARLLADGRPVSFRQEGWRIILTGLPKGGPDKLAGVTVIRLDFAERPEFVGCATTMVVD